MSNRVPERRRNDRRIGDRRTRNLEDRLARLNKAEHDLITYITDTLRDHGFDHEESNDG